jgi:hypothetical protein
MPIYIINPKNAGVKKGVGDQRKGLNIYYAMNQFFGVKPVNHNPICIYMFIFIIYQSID